MKSIAMATLLVALLGGSTTALAGGNGHGCGYNCGGGGYYPGYRPGGYYRPYYGYQHKNNNNSNDSWAYALGGLVLGSVLTNAYNNNRAQQPVYVEQTTTTYQPVQVQRVIVAQPRHLLRDLNGNCFERTTDSAGNELRTELPPSACNW